MSGNKLYVIGNGFDKHHGLPCGNAHTFEDAKNATACVFALGLSYFKLVEF